MGLGGLGHCLMGYVVQIVHVLLDLAMEARAPHRELASVLLSDLACAHVINTRDISDGL